MQTDEKNSPKLQNVYSFGSDKKLVVKQLSMLCTNYAMTIKGSSSTTSQHFPHIWLQITYS